MASYEKVAEQLQLPDNDTGDYAEDGTIFYVPPPLTPWEKAWTEQFATSQPPSFGPEMRALLFPTLVGDPSAFDSIDPELGAKALGSPTTASDVDDSKAPYVYLAHGSYGATCRPSLESFRRWGLCMEASPVRFFYDTLFPYLVRSIRAVSALVGAKPTDVVLTTNVEVGTNAVLRSFPPKSNEKIIAFDVTYTAVLYSAQHACAGIEGAELLTIPMTTPASRATIINDLRTFLQTYDTARGKIHMGIFQHVTSPTALLLPMGEIVSLCHEYGILVVVDGAHTLGQIPLNLSTLDADFYVTNTHKWFCNPRGCALLWAHEKHHSQLYPLTTSWGHPFKDSFSARFIWQGTADYGPMLALFLSVRFFEWIGYDRIVQRNHNLALACSDVLVRGWGTGTLVLPGDGSTDYETTMMGSMATVRIPPAHGEKGEPLTIDLGGILLAEHNIEVPVFTFREQRFLRVSLHIYNDMDQCLRLGRAVLEVLGYPSDFQGYKVLSGHA